MRRFSKLASRDLLECGRIAVIDPVYLVFIGRIQALPFDVDTITIRWTKSHREERIGIALHPSRQLIERLGRSVSL